MAESTDAPSAPSSSASFPQLLLELRDLVIAYVKQETLIPLRQLGRYIGFGIVGSVFLGVGVVLLAVGGLRALQTETGSTFTGDWSWAPYGITAVGLFFGGVIVWKARGITRRARRNKNEKEEPA